MCQLHKSRASAQLLASWILYLGSNILLQLEIRHRLVDGLGIRRDERGGCAHALGVLEAADGLVDLEVDAAVVLHADDAEERADCLGGIALATDDLAHVSRADIEREEHSHLIDCALDFDLVRIVYKGLDDVLEELLVFLHVRKGYS